MIGSPGKYIEKASAACCDSDCELSTCDFTITIAKVTPCSLITAPWIFIVLPHFNTHGRIWAGIQPAQIAAWLTPWAGTDHAHKSSFPGFAHSDHGSGVPIFGFARFPARARWLPSGSDAPKSVANCRRLERPIHYRGEQHADSSCSLRKPQN